MLVGDVFGAETATLITYHGYFIIAGVALFYWKVIEKKPLTAMGLSKETALILPKMEPLLFIFVCAIFPALFYRPAGLPLYQLALCPHI